MGEVLVCCDVAGQCAARCQRQGDTHGREPDGEVEGQLAGFGPLSSPLSGAVPRRGQRRTVTVGGNSTSEHGGPLSDCLERMRGATRGRQGFTPGRPRHAHLQPPEVQGRV